jgi:hypothetical protein
MLVSWTDQAEPTLPEQRLCALRDSGVAADHNPLPSLEGMIAAHMSRRDQFFTTSEFVTVIRHGGSQ